MAITSSRRGYRRSWPMKEFLELKDEDMKNYIFIKGMVDRGGSEVKHKEDDDKLGWYNLNYTLKQNNQGKFYRNSVIKEYIVYDKKTKKARVSAIHNTIKVPFLNKYIKYAQLISDTFLWRLTPTFCKKLVEGKIASISDILKYHRSYTMKNKSLDLNTIYSILLWDAAPILPLLEDPENLTSPEEVQSILNTIGTSRPFKIKVEEIPKLGEKYDRWLKEQGEKYAKFTGQGDAKCSSGPGSQPYITRTDVFGQLSAQY